MKTGVSYYGNRIPRHVSTDMEEIAQNHCTFVVHTLSENDLKYYHETMHQIVEISHQAGLEVYLDPWGVGRVFGGEAFSHFACEHLQARQILSDGSSAPAACFNHPAFGEFMHQWTRAAIEMGADVLFWDEPHFIKRVPKSEDELWACRCEACQQKFRQQFGHPLPLKFTEEVHRFRHESVMSFLQELCHLVKSQGRKNALCFLPNQEDEDSELALWTRLALMNDLDIIGTDPYWWSRKLDVKAYVSKPAQKIVKMAREYGKEGQMWVQNFLITPETEEYVRIAIRTFYEAGIRNIAAWSYWGAGYMSSLCSENPDRVWKILGQEYAHLRQISRD